MAHKPKHASHASSRVRHARAESKFLHQSHTDIDGNLQLGKGDLLSLIRALETERVNAAPWQVSSLRHTLDTLTRIAEARVKRGRS